MDRPYALLSAAISLDGKLHPCDNGKAKIGSDRDRKRLLSLRRKVDAIVIGAKTLAIDTGPKVTGDCEDRAENPLNIVCSTTLDIDLSLPFFQTSITHKIIYTSESAPIKKIKEASKFAEVIAVAPFSGYVDLRKCMENLSQKGIKTLLWEGGGQIYRSAIQHNLVDELHITLCPLALSGKKNSSLFQGKGFSILNSPRFKLLSSEPVGDELFLIYKTRA